jgi:hypothetical protein
MSWGTTDGKPLLDESEVQPIQFKELLTLPIPPEFHIPSQRTPEE